MNVTIGQRVAALRKSGSVLDYSGTVVALRREGASAEIRYSDTKTESSAVHDDFMFSMEPAYRLAADVIRTANGAEVTDELITKVVKSHWARPDLFQIGRVQWVLKHDRAGIRER